MFDKLQVEISRGRECRGFSREEMGIEWLILTALMILPEVSSTRYIVGGNRGWSAGVNYTIWAMDKRFYNGDWIFFVYDRNQMSVLEVNKTDYDNCNSDNPIHNWSTGAGRVVIPLNVTRSYYFISGYGFCYSDMKVAFNVENLPHPPSPPPMMNPEILPPPSLSPDSEHSDSLESPRPSSPLPNPHVSGHMTPLISPVKTYFLRHFHLHLPW